MVYWIVITLALAGGALWMWLTIAHIGRTTPGDPIESRPGTALVLIDLQKVFWDDAHYDAETRERVEAAVAREVDVAQARNVPVIVLRQEWSTLGSKLLARLTMKGEAIAGSAGTELAEPFAGVGDHAVVKRVQDGFETGELDVVLRVLGVGRLRIAGLDGVHCVAKTAQAALNRGFEVELVADGIASSEPARFADVKEALVGQGARMA